jgi:hypothetical protein
MAGYFWYFESTKARVELGFEARDAAATLLDTVTYIRRQFLGDRGPGDRGAGRAA